MLLDALLSLGQVLPWVFPVLLGALLLDQPVVWGLAAAATLFFLWVLRPTLHAQGRSIERAQAPALFEALDELRLRLDVPGRMELRLDDRLNASASETRGLFGLLGTRRVLTLGVPLLLLMSRTQMLAVIAHEFGHFSRRHGAQGHWLYRAHLGLLESVQAADASSSPWDRALAACAARIVPTFSAAAFVQSRQCEFEADRDAVSCAGAEAFASALSRLAVIAQWLEVRSPDLLVAWQREEAAAPDDGWRQLKVRLEAEDGAVMETLLKQAMADRSGWSATHPTLAERLAALSLSSGLDEARVEPAGPSLLGEAWSEQLRLTESGWRDRQAFHWHGSHALQKHVWLPLRARWGASEALSGGERLLLAQAQMAFAPDCSLPVLEALGRAGPEDQSLLFLHAAAKLQQGDADALAELETLASRRAALRVPVYEQLVAHFEAAGDTSKAAHWGLHLERAAARRAAAVDSFLAGYQAGHFAPAALAGEAREVLASCLAADSEVSGACLVQGEAALATAAAVDADRLRIVLIALRLRPGVHEQGVGERYMALLTPLLEPETHLVYRGYYETEQLAAPLQAAFDSLPYTANLPTA